MISFGELRKKSIEWRVELDVVEKIYALDWLLKGLFERPALHGALVLTGPAALSKAYFPPSPPPAPGSELSYPPASDADLLAPGLVAGALEGEMVAVAEDAARVSSLQLRVHSFQPSEARVEFTGPLGRRSAAQPFIVLRFRPHAPQRAPVERPLLHPFRDSCAVTLRVVSIEELIAEGMVLYARAPRARDVFDLWYLLKHAPPELDRAAARETAVALAASKRVKLRPQLEASYAPLLARAWENALRDVPGHPPFERLREELEGEINAILGGS